MPALPALTRAYASRVNVPFPDTSSVTRLVQSATWLLKAHLMDQLTTGNATNARNAASVWTCSYSCNGTTAGTVGDGVDRWGSTFTAANLVSASTGNAHSWIVLRNTGSGLWCCIDMNRAPNIYGQEQAIRVGFSRVGYTGGTTTTGPTATDEWVAGRYEGIGTGYGEYIVSDTFTGGANYSHFVTSVDGSFMYFTSRAGQGKFSAFVSLTQSVGARAGDSYNWFAVQEATTSGRGAFLGSGTPRTFCSRAPNNSNVVQQGGNMYSATFGGTDLLDVGVDNLTNEYLAFPIYIASRSPQVAWRGQIPDYYLISGGTVGSSVPSVAAQERIVIGNYVLPCPGSGTPPIV